MQICKHLDNVHCFQFCLRNVTKYFTVNKKTKEVWCNALWGNLLWGNAFEFPIDFGLISIPNMLNFHHNLIEKYNIK